MKKVIAILLSVVMLLTCSGVAVFAESTENNEPVVEENVPSMKNEVVNEVQNETENVEDEYSEYFN